MPLRVKLENWSLVRFVLLSIHVCLLCLLSDKGVVKIEKKPTTDDEKKEEWKVPDGIQRDAPWWSDEDPTLDVCSKPLPSDAMTCSDKQARWHYNRFTGKCERFIGCPTNGNNFARKRYCKEQCRYKYIKKVESKSLSIVEDKVCFESLPSNAYTCIDKTKRWHYNAQTGKCEKFYGCASQGNNFSKKVACKSKCLQKRTHPSFYRGNLLSNQT